MPRKKHDALSKILYKFETVPIFQWGNRHRIGEIAHHPRMIRGIVDDDRSQRVLREIIIGGAAGTSHVADDPLFWQGRLQGRESPVGTFRDIVGVATAGGGRFGEHAHARQEGAHDEDGASYGKPSVG